jgi:hypothetical protein
MSMRGFREGFAVAILLGLAGPLAAQRDAGAARTGQWLGAGLGLGWGRVSCPGLCEANRHSSITGYFRAGGTLSRRALLGLEATGWTQRDRDVDEFILGLTAAVYYYPNPRRRLFYKAGASVLRYQIDDGADRLTSTGFGPHLGVGLDRPIGPTVSLTPYLNVVLASWGGGLKFNGTQFRDDVSVMLVQLGVGVTWH